MTSLIIFKRADGTITGRCDARCHNAKGPICKCICGGINHGVGNNLAVESTMHFQHTRDRSAIPGEYVYPPGQLTLFGGGKP